MSETIHRPLLLMVPPQHEVDPEALLELRRVMGDKYGAKLWVRPLDVPVMSCWLRLIGPWGRHSTQDVHASLLPLIEASFYSLDWLDDSA